MHLDFRERPQCAQIRVLVGWRAGVRNPGDMGGEIQQLVDCASLRKQQPAQLNWIEPFELGPLDRSVIQVEAVDIDSSSHLRPHIKSKGHSGEQPLSRQRAADG